MIEKIGDKLVNVSKEEYGYYQEVLQIVGGAEYFCDLLEVDDEGFITVIKPRKSIPWSVLFFCQQLMISQRLKFIDDFRRNLHEVKK